MSRQCDYCDALEKDLARLTKERDDLRALADELAGALEIVEHGDLDTSGGIGHYVHRCSVCDKQMPRHDDDCELMLALVHYREIAGKEVGDG